MDLNLTKRQSEIFDFIKGHLDKTGYPPTVREIGSALGLHSPSTVHAHLAKLESSGVLRRDPSKPRAIEILVERTKRVMRPSIPLVGQVAAGSPILAEEALVDEAGITEDSESEEVEEEAMVEELRRFLDQANPDDFRS